MSTIETGTIFSVGYESVREARECGLIMPEWMPLFKLPAPEQEQVDRFDELCDLSTDGWVDCGGRLFQLTRRPEKGNLIRSVQELTEREDGSRVLETSNLIQHRDGDWYLEVHAAPLSPNGKPQEPELGSMSVVPGSHGSALMAHYMVAYEGKPYVLEVSTLPEAV